MKLDLLDVSRVNKLPLASLSFSVTRTLVNGVHQHRSR